MGWFDENDEVLDLTLLRDKGILKIEEEKKREDNAKRDGDVLDFTAGNAKPDDAGSGSSSPAPNFGFLADMAGVGANAAAGAGADAGTASYYGSGESKNCDEGRSEFNALRIKLDDVEYRLARLIERLEKIEVGLKR
jgi:hypothetical protein